MLNMQKEVLNRMELDVVQLHPDFWKSTEETNLCGVVTNQMSTLPLLSALSCGEYETVNEGMKFLSSNMVRYYVQQLCVHVKEMCGQLFLNRKPTKKERSKMESKLNVTVFPGCVEFLECDVGTKCFSESKDNHVFDTDEPMGEERKSDIEVWIDLDKHCWPCNTVRIQGTECRNKLKTSRLVRQIFRSDIDIVLDGGFRVEPSLSERKLRYFPVEGSIRYGQSWRRGIRKNIIRAVTN